MMIEKKQLTDTENILFFPTPLSILGSYHNKDTQKTDFLKELDSSNLSKTYLLTKDFIYLKSTSPQTLEDLTLLSIALLDEFTLSSTKLVAPNTNIEEKISLILKLIIAPHLQKDGGDIKLNKFENNIVYVNFLGKCNGCPYALKTLKERVEKNLITYLPHITEAKLV